jgi:hypothetical protein
MTTDRDPMIGALLDRLEPPPAPDLEFWDDLREQLDGGPRVVELRPLPPGAPKPDRRAAYRRRAIAALVAAAVIAAGVVGITKATRHDDDRVVPVGPPTTAQITPTTTAVGDPGANGSTIVDPSRSDSGVQSAVHTWIQAVERGNTDLAWSLVGPQSRSSVDRTAFGSMLQELAATWAPFDRDDLVRTGYPLDPKHQVWVVHVALPDGSKAQAIGAGLRPGTRATPSRGDLSYYVEPFLPGTALSLVSFPLGSSGPGSPQVQAGSSIQVHVDTDAQGSVIAVDGQAISATMLTRDAGGNISAISTRGLRAGRHDVLVAELTKEGALALVDQTFTVVAG